MGHKHVKRHISGSCRCVGWQPELSWSPKLPCTIVLRWLSTATNFHTNFHTSLLQLLQNTARTAPLVGGQLSCSCPALLCWGPLLLC